MASKYKHIREKAIQLRTEKHMTLDQIVERLQVKRTTVYHWIKDIPIPRTAQQSEVQRKGTEAMQKKYREKREAAYAEGLAQAPALFEDPLFRDFVVLYMAEGTKKHKNEVVIVNSDPYVVEIGYYWIKRFTTQKVSFNLQMHIDHDEDELKRYWAERLGIESDQIVTTRKSNSNQLTGRNWRSVNGLLSVRTGDTYLREKLQAWIDYLKQQWYNRQVE